MFAREELRFPVDALHNPGELIGVHPWTDMGEKFRGTRFYLFIGNILQAKRVCIPIIVDIAHS
jgi:hypothetical protein